MEKNNTLTQYYFIDRETTNIIKGVALIFMFIHHLFTFPDWYVDGVSYPHLQDFAYSFCAPFKLCVPLFAFLTGYFYFFAKNKTISYSLKKCTDVWLNYFITFVLLLIPAILFNTYDFSIIKFLLEAVGLTRPTMVFCWYVVFYFTAMFILPIYSRLSEKNSVLPFFFSLIIPLIIIPIAEKAIPANLSGLFQLVDNLQWFPCVAIGYVFAQHKLFFNILKAVTTKNIFINIIIGGFFMIIPFVARKFSANYDFIYAPLFIYGLVSITNLIKNRKLLFPLSIIGKYSLSMWFLHCAFFNTYKEYTQWLLFLPKNPVLVLLWGLFICLVASYVIMIPINFIIKMKNKIFKWQ